jgi:hypothetical protein
MTITIGQGITVQKGIRIGRIVVPPAFIGAPFEGGYYAGKINQSGTEYYLVVSPKATGQDFLTWNNGDFTAGTDSVIDGPANTAAMIAAGDHPAAIFCNDLTIGGFTDWYMPAKNELEVLYYFLKPTTATNDTGSGSNANAVAPEPISTNYSTGSPAQTTAALFQTGGSESIEVTIGWFWSSTQINTALANGQRFTTGIQEPYAKSGARAVRAIRRVPV